MDKTGNHQLNVHDNIYLDRLDKAGNKISDKAEREVVGSDKHLPDIKLGDDHHEKCGNCYGADTPEKPCCNSCDDVQEAYRKKGWAFTNPQTIEQCVKEGFVEQLKHQKEEMCRVRGYLKVSRVAGNFNIVPGKFILQNARYVLDSQLFEFDRSFNVSHIINHLSFGVDYPGMKNPLDGVSKSWMNKQTSAMYEYFVKVVPTVYADLRGNVINTNQFSVTEYVQNIEQHSMSNRGVPGFFVMYDLSPIIVDYKENSRSFLHFVTNLCAIIGGVFTVASLVDSLLYSGLKTLKKKVELGKAS